MHKNNAIYLLVLFIFLACIEKGLNLKIRFDQVRGLQANNRVIYDDNHVGEVTRVFYSKEGHYVVDLTIKKDFANAFTDHAKFYIIEDPQDKKYKAVEMIQLQKGGTPLADGSLVEGSTKSSALYQKMLGDFDKEAKKLTMQFQQFLKDLSRMPESAEFKKLQKELEELAEEMQRAGKATQDKIQHEILPMIKKELEQLKERLKEFGREEEVEPLERQLEQLKLVLKPSSFLKKNHNPI